MFFLGLIPLLAGGGGAAVAGGGGAVVVGGLTTSQVLVAGGLLAAGTGAVVYSQSRSRSRAEATPCLDCNGEIWRAVAMAQGEDVGGTSGSTVSAGPVMNTQPITKAQGHERFDATRAMLTRRQAATREDALLRARRFLDSHSWLGKRSFEVRGVRGGIRWDLDSYGPSDNFVS
jgi:hypothetical protein